MLRYLEIKKALQEMIASSTPGERLEDRVTLCRKLETTRTTLDKAIRELQTEGRLTSRKGSGTFISSSLALNGISQTNWGIIVPNIQQTIYSTLVSVVESYAQARDCNTILCNSEENVNKQSQFIRRLSGAGAAGFIIVPVILSSLEENRKLYSDLLCSGIPFVFCNRSVEGISAPVITSNNFYGGFIATKHLLEKGYRRIAYISKYRYSTCLERFQGYMTALMEAGIPIDRNLVRVSENNKAPIRYYDEAVSLLREEHVDAIFAFNDYGAFEIARAVADCGLKISDDVGLIGYDCVQDNGYYTPEIGFSSVSYGIEQIALKAAEVLQKICSGTYTSSGFDYYLYQPKLCIRETCMGPVKHNTNDTES